jgi:heme exporter protein D
MWEAMGVYILSDLMNFFQVLNAISLIQEIWKEQQRQQKLSVAYHTKPIILAFWCILF